MSKFEDVLTDWKSELNTIEHLDFDPEQPCECTNRDGSACGTAATTVGRHRCCGFSWLLCSQHTLEARLVLVMAGPLMCARCLVVWPLAILSTEFIPIGGVS